MRTHWLMMAGLLGFLGAGRAVGVADILAELTRQQAGVTKRFSSGRFDPESNADAYHLAPGQRFTAAELEGPGEIRHIWFTVASADRRWPRSLVLRIFWDGADVPSVEAPIGDFFAAGHGMRANVSTIPIEVTSYGRALNSYWRMPFRERARVELWNQSSNRMTVYCQVNWVQLPSLPPDTLYFHARYHQEFPVKPFSPYTIFQGEGEGQYVGTVLSSQSSFGVWFGESDDRFYIDGEPVPSLVGTGTEDYFTDAWNLRLFSNPNAGVTLCEPQSVDCRLTAYRWHFQPPVIFRKSLKVEIERRSFLDERDPQTGARKLHDFKFRPDFFSSVAFWYQKGVARPFCELPPLTERLNPESWLEVKDMADRLPCSAGLKPAVRSNRTCQGKTMLWVENQDIGAWLEVPFTIETEAQYSLSAFQVLHREGGRWKATLRGAGQTQVLDAALDFYDAYGTLKENWPESLVYGTVREAKLGVLRLAPGPYTLRFECVGQNPLSDERRTGKPGRSLGLDAISVRRLPWDRMDQWLANYLADEQRRNAEMEREAKQWVAQLAQAVSDSMRSGAGLPRSLAEVAHRLPGARLPADPWGQPYQYVLPGLFRPESFDVFSVRGDSRAPAAWIGNWERPYRLADALEGEELQVAGASPGTRALVQELTNRSVPDLSGGKHLFLRFGASGDEARLRLPKPLPAGVYTVILSRVTSWDYGKVQWLLNEAPLGEPVDGFSQETWRRVTVARGVRLPEGARELRAKVVGAHPQSCGFNASLDAIRIAPEP
ncbi:MAG TPA: DUF2961 domain-containing protein [Candidatus Paceibacterota bacterium]|nr:DUF2961 domain-containing protein [Candidatus Paceibacterota bacterium]HRT55214.1 DUF2961 domain-containing protein [Candidatus Paceibacterota bacterium]